MAATKRVEQAPDPWDNLSEALHPLAVAYNAQIQSIARDCVAECVEHEGDLDETLHETIDGHEWVIYTFKARVVAIISDNENAYSEEFGDEPSTADGNARRHSRVPRRLPRRRHLRLRRRGFHAGAISCESNGAGFQCCAVIRATSRGQHGRKNDIQRQASPTNRPELRAGRLLHVQRGVSRPSL